jgi:hypothetical protein
MRRISLSFLPAFFVLFFDPTGCAVVVGASLRSLLEIRISFVLLYLI